MIVIGITGSIGMGKTTIASMLGILNIPIYDADYEVKKLIENSSLIKKKIKNEWPNVIYKNEGKDVVSKRKLGDLIFKNTKYKVKLEEIIHPLVLKKRNIFLKKYKNKKFIVAIDVPLLYETGANKICNYIFLALTSEENQKKRVLRRSNMTEEKFMLIKKNQWSDNKKKLQSPYIINTSYGKFFTFLLTILFLINVVYKERINRI
jgi:dephospho-CoA kinase